MLSAVIETQGKQFVVKKGDVLVVDRLDAEDGATLNIDKVLLVQKEDGEDIQIGQPFVEKASVAAKVLGHQRGQKITVYKYKRRKGYHKKQGHRQEQTRLEIQDIAVS